MKTKITLLFLLFLFPFRTIAQLNLIGCYPLNNSFDDFSGNNYNGTANNLTSTSDRNSNLNHAFNFSGSNSNILINDSGFRLNSFTYSVWCKLKNIPSRGSYYSVIAIGGIIADQSLLVGNNAGPGHIGFGVGSWDSLPDAHSCYQGTLPNINEWYHIVFTRDNDSLKMFINNDLICFQTTGDNAGYIGSPQALSIGSRTSNLTQNFIGDIDEIKVFNRVLTYPEIISLDGICNLKTDVTNLESVDNFISVFPNPANLEVTINFEKIARYNVQLCNTLGEILEETEINSATLSYNISSYAKGIYFITVTDEMRNKEVRKVIKM